MCERLDEDLFGLSSQVIMKLMEMMEQGSDFVVMLVKKLAPPLVTLLSAEAEIQYVALRNINLIVQKRYVLRLGSSTSSSRRGMYFVWAHQPHRPKEVRTSSGLINLIVQKRFVLRLASSISSSRRGTYFVWAHQPHRLEEVSRRGTYRI